MKKYKIFKISIVILSLAIFVAPISRLTAQTEVNQEYEITAGEAADLLDVYYGLESEDEPMLDGPIIIDDTNKAPEDEYYLAKIIEIIEEGQEDLGSGYVEDYQELKIQILNGKDKGEEVFLRNSGIKSLDQYFRKVGAGDRVVLIKIYEYDGNFNYYINDVYRLNSIILIFALFFGLAIFFGRWKGLTSILGLIFSIIIIAAFIVPGIMSGRDPVLVTLVGAVIIALVSLYLAHGFNRQTTLALMSTLFTLALSIVFAYLFVNLAQLFGLGKEEAYYVQIGKEAFVNLKGLLLAGIIIGTLGVLDDITTAQTAVVMELKRTKSDLTKAQLYHKGIRVGKEHIASLVNTLFLAYAGASLPLFILFNSNNQIPMWLVINSELVAEEIIRTLVGSLALILAVPISTYLAAWYLSKQTADKHPVDQPILHKH